MPSFAWIAVTSRCNLSCTHCQRGLLKQQGLLKGHEMSGRVFQKLESEVFPHLDRIQFGGNNFGEQLMASKWDDIFAIISKLKIDTSIVTNGSLLNPDRIKAMVAAGVEFNFSLEGTGKASYESVRGHGFDRFLDNIKQTCEEKIRRPKNGARINLGFTIFRDNIRELTDLIEMAARLNVDRVVVTHFAPWQENQRRQSLVYHKDLCDQMLERATSLATELGIRVDLPKPFGTNNRHEKTNIQQSNSIKPCYHPWQSFSVNENGEVMPCCATSTVMGNLEKTSFYDIWNGAKYRKLRKTVNSPRPLIFCRDCAFRDIDVASTETISFWNDEEHLLAAIGIEQQKDSSSLVLRKMKNYLKKTKWGQKTLPYMIDLYRRHGAFYAADIYDGWMRPLARRLTGRM
jgi:radical SAM protein with 4Fe4S-binding SPASM domain